MDGKSEVLCCSYREERYTYIENISSQFHWFPSVGSGREEIVNYIIKQIERCIWGVCGSTVVLAVIHKEGLNFYGKQVLWQ